MYGVMHGGIDEVSEHESGEERKNKRLQAQQRSQAVHHHEQGTGYDEAGNRWHEQALPVAGVFMMVSMNQVNEFDGPLAAGCKMKGEAVDHVFEKRPEENTRQEGQCGLSGAEFTDEDAEIDRIADQRQIHPPNHQRMRLGEPLEMAVPE